jgi:anaphase-promoting complex subunit 2
MGDVISYLLTLYDREDFITELKNILGEHLLRNEDTEFEKEVTLLELFKKRLGEDKLQACEVMLRDVQESKRMNVMIEKTQPPRNRLPQLRSQILSSFFWPTLRDDTFRVPLPVRVAQEQYATGFEAIKDMRKLQWLQALGRVEVELELEDRKIQIDCSTWQASVIYAFQQQEGEPNRVGGILRKVEQLEEMLEMEEGLVRQAVTFWVGERVLAPHPSNPDAFTVLESLPSSTSAAAAAAAAAEQAQRTNASAAGVVSSSSLLDKNRDLYEQFVLGMLTNQGAMPKGRILMMLKMAVPGGFPGGAEEVGELLEGLKVKEKLVPAAGDVWSVKKG